MAENIFAEGVNFYRPNEKAPDFIKGQVVIIVSDLLKFQTTHSLPDKIRFDLKKSAKGNLYLSLNTYNPMKKEDGETEVETKPESPF